MASLTHRYIPRTARTEENLFIEEYYSSTDTKIYIDDIEQTEISYISYALNEQLKPIFGYDSNTFDDVAIGTRIVTGVFKTPICNSERQSTAADIKARALSATYGDTSLGAGDYNDTEAGRVDQTDWIGNTNRTPGESGTYDQYEYEDDVSYEYRNKLELLGYLDEGSFTKEALIAAIKRFQEDNGEINATGKLDYRTMTAINNAVVKKESKASLTIPAGTMIYSVPMRAAPLFANGIESETKAFVMDVFEGAGGTLEWLWVTLSDGTAGFVNANDNAEFKQYITDFMTP